MKSPNKLASPAQKIVFNKYGEVGLKAYELIDGRRTAHEMMRNLKINESRLSEIIHFLVEQGIVMVDYPKGSQA